MLNRFQLYIGILLYRYPVVAGSNEQCAPRVLFNTIVLDLYIVRKTRSILTDANQAPGFFILTFVQSAFGNGTISNQQARFTQGVVSVY